jgi:hypothetical protein
MTALNEEQVAEFFHRSYTAVDGLWFMKVEEKYGFATALEIDNEVWGVLPKIQARMLKTMRRMGNGLDALIECLDTKLTLDGFKFDIQKSKDDRRIRVVINECPWHGQMIKSGRENLSGRVGSVICNTEYSVWASEFGDDLGFELQSEICQGAESCVLEFTQRS